MCVWSTGIGPQPLIKDLAKKIPGQQNTRALTTDDVSFGYRLWLRLSDLDLALSLALAFALVLALAIGFGFGCGRGLQLHPAHSWLMVHGSWLMAHGSWLMAHGSWLMAHG